MKVLVIGSGGREHALAWKAAQSSKVETVYVAPGNAGTAREPKLENVAIGVEDIDTLVKFAQDNAIDLTIVGPEAPLVIGVVDTFRAAGLRCFGPTESAAQLPSPRISWRVRGSQRLLTKTSPRSNPPSPTSTNTAHRSSSRPTAWRRVKASSSL